MGKIKVEVLFPITNPVFKNQEKRKMKWTLLNYHENLW